MSAFQKKVFSRPSSANSEEYDPCVPFPYHRRPGEEAAYDIWDESKKGEVADFMGATTNKLEALKKSMH